MTRSGAPFHGAHGEGRSAISPAASHSGAEPCARAFPAARARRNAPVISDNAVVAAPINWRAESTGSRLPLSRPQHNRLKSWQKSIGHADFGCAAPLELEARQTRLAAWECHQTAAFTAPHRTSLPFNYPHFAPTSPPTRFCEFLNRMNRL
jgi:hypothetical protein